MKRIHLIKFLLLLTVISLGACRSVKNSGDNTPQNATIKPPIRVLRSADKFAAYRNIPYTEKAHSNQKLDIYLPQNSEGNAPIVMYIHGGAWLYGWKEGIADERNGQWSFIKNLLNNGYAVVSMGYRFAPEFRSPTQVDDVTTAYYFITQNAHKYGLNGTRVAVMGDSAGGHLAEYLATTLGNSKIRATVPFYAPSDLCNNLTTFYRKNGKRSKHNKESFIFKLIGLKVPKRTSVEELLVGEKFGTPEFEKKLSAISPINKVSYTSPPTLMFHGDQDPIVKIIHSQRFLEELQKLGVPSELVIVKGAGHGGKKFWTTPEYQQKIIAFLDKYLKTAKF